MDPHYHIISTANEGGYEGLPATHFSEYASTPNSFQRIGGVGGGGADENAALYGQISSHPLQHQMTAVPHQHPPPTYETVLNGHPVAPVANYAGYSPTAHAMEYVQSVYQMQFAAQGIGHGFTDDMPYGARTMVNSEGKRKRRRIITHDQRKAANIRERRRMFHLNEAFDQLRKRVPTFAYEKKLSRIETLKLAVTYIQFMGELVEEMGGDKQCKSINDSATSDEGLGTSGDASSLDLDISPGGKCKNNKNKSSSNILCDMDENEKTLLTDDDSDFDDNDL